MVDKVTIGNCTLYCGDSLEILPQLDEVDAVVTDPPYHLTSITKRFGKKSSKPAHQGTDGAFKKLTTGFMGKEWDGGDIAFRKGTWEFIFKLLKPGGHLLAFSSSRTYHKMAIAVENAGFEIRDQLMWLYGSGFPKNFDIGKGNSKWEGWGTALKPAHEPIIMARKPLSEKSIVDNLFKHETGAINIDGCRVDNNRYPANVMHDGSDVIVNKFPKTAKGSSKPRKRSTVGMFGMPNDKTTEYADEGSAARFFYCPKTSKSEKNNADKNTHPTVKPIKLMGYLCRLITQKDKLVLDPFMGSGSTGIAAKNEGFNFIGIEKEKEYFDIACKRIEQAHKQYSLL